MNEICKSGIRMAQLIFAITGINKLAACSYGKLQKDMVIMEDEIITFEEIEKPRLSKDMKKKKISVIQDESEQKKKPHLVAMEPIANFILAEQKSDKRDAKSWNQAIQEGTDGLNIEIIQSTSDEGSAIKKYREIYLNDVHHSPDLFHIQHEIHKATAGPLASKRRHHEEALKAAQHKHSKQLQKQLSLERDSKNQPIEHTMNATRQALQTLESDILKNQSMLAKIDSWKNRISAAIAMISQIYHPYDIQSGQVHTAEQINDCLEKQFIDIKAVAKEMGLSKKSLARINKAHRLVTQMTATVTFYFNTIDAIIDEHALSPDVEELMKNKLIPIEYLKMAAEKMQVAEDKHAVCSATIKNTHWRSLKTLPKYPISGLQKPLK